MRLALLLLVGLLTVAPAAAQTRSVLDDPAFEAEAQRGLNALYNLRFPEAERSFATLAQRYPDHPAGPFLQALVPWWQILLDLSDTSRDAAFYAAMDATIDRADRLLRRDRRNQDALFFKGAALAFRGRLRANRRDYWRAAWDGKSAVDYIFDLADRNPTNADFGFGKGVYDYYSVALRERHGWARPIMALFPGGNKVRGIGHLTQTFRQGRYLNTEAAYFLVQIYDLYERDYTRTLIYLRHLRRTYPDNAFFHAMEGRIHARYGHWDESQATFQAILQRYEQRRTGYNDALAEQTYYYLGRHAMMEGDYQTALAHYGRLQQIGARRSQATYFEVLGRLRLGMTYDALGQRSQAEARYREVLAMPDLGGAHERARFYLRRPYRP